VYISRQSISVAWLLCITVTMLLVVDHQLVGICCRLCPAAVKVAVGLHSSMRLAAVLAVANSTVLVLLATAVAAEGLALTLAGEEN
jgi:glucose-6-phosphate-specific signal transduction histidine kinase